MIFTFALILIIVAGIIWYFLEKREKARTDQGKPRLASWRLALASFAALVALFSGGCSLLFLPEAITGNPYIDPMAVLIIGVIPFAVALLVLWLCLRRGPANDASSAPPPAAPPS